MSGYANFWIRLCYKLFPWWFIECPIKNKHSRTQLICNCGVNMHCGDHSSDSYGYIQGSWYKLKKENHGDWVK